MAAVECAQEQPRRDQQQEGDRHLAGDERVLRGGAARAGAGRVVAQPGIDVDARRLQRRDQAEHDAGGERHDEREDEHACVGGEVQRQRQVHR